MTKIDRTHGSGGSATAALIEEVFKSTFSNKYLDELSDSAVVPGSESIAVTTDSFVVRPVIYPGGDIGRLAVCGTVNDILMSGAKPVYLTAGYILEEGLDLEVLKRVAGSMAKAAAEAGVRIVAGDTKVVGAIEPGDPGLMINTSGIGFPDKGTRISPAEIKPGDTVIVSGNLGDHHAAIMGCRLSVENSIVSDNAPLVDMISRLKETKITIHAMRDVTRGGLATVLNEFSEACGCRIRLEEEKIPVSDEVGSFCGLLGLDPLYMGNEGKCVFILPKECAEAALDVIRGSKYGGNAAIIGYVTDDPAGVTIRTRIGGEKVVGPLCGEGLPRIC